MTAARPARVAISTVMTAIVLLVFFDRTFYLNDTNAIRTSAFLLGYFRHDYLQLLFFVVMMAMLEQMIDHDFEDAMHTGICHRIEHLLSPPFRLQDTR